MAQPTRADRADTAPSSNWTEKAKSTAQTAGGGVNSCGLIERGNPGQELLHLSTSPHHSNTNVIPLLPRPRSLSITNSGAFAKISLLRSSKLDQLSPLTNAAISPLSLRWRKNPRTANL